MESKFNIDNFERFLKEKTDEFRMYPSKRVWYSIYNSMHPGNRLPSISMCIVLIFSLLLIGYLNTDTSKLLNINQDSSTISTGAQSDPEHIHPFNQYTVTSVQQSPGNQVFIATNKPALVKDLSSATVSGKATFLNKNKITNVAVQRTVSFNTDNTTPGELNYRTPGTAFIATTENDKLALVLTPEVNKSTIPLGETAAQAMAVKPADNVFMTGQEENAVTSSVALLQTGSTIKNNTQSQNGNHTDVDLAIAQTIKEPHVSIIAINVNKHNLENNKRVALSETDKAWIEDFAMHNRPAAKKWAGKLSWQAYITPSVVYRTLHNTAEGKSPAGNTGNINNTDVDILVNQKPSFGIETGIALQYDVLKRVKLKMGLQLNYTRYNSLGFDNYHPISTSITMISEDKQSTYEVFSTTPYSNTTGLTAVKLHNETYQLSLPIGTDFKLATVDNFEWYVGASIQPSFIIYGRSYLISTDRRNYVQEPSLLNSFNLNVGFETYISFKTKNGYTWQVGPEFRSQIFSTNSKSYSVEERLQNYGFKVGLSKKL